MNIIKSAHTEKSVSFVMTISKNMKSNIIKNKNAKRDWLPAKSVKINRLNKRIMKGISNRNVPFL
jgi:hypothetical protein